MKEKKKSLLTLPPEVRNMIWELLVLQKDEVVVKEGGSEGAPGYSRPAILKVSREICRDVSPRL
jgi:hypothetical protein